MSAVVLGHNCLLVYARLHLREHLGPITPIQSRGAVVYVYSASLRNHVAQPGDFLLLGLYLAVTWVCDLLPPVYYSFAGGAWIDRVLLCLVVQDGVRTPITSPTRRSTASRTSRTTNSPTPSSSTPSTGAPPTRP